MNVRLLRKIKKHILAEPKRLRMSNWIVREGEWTVVKGRFEFAESSSWGEPKYQAVPKCGTVGCISGWAQILSKSRDSSLTILDINSLQSGRLFYVPEWPKQFMEKYLVAKTASTRANITAKRIDHFISTKGAE